MFSFLTIIAAVLVAQAVPEFDGKEPHVFVMNDGETLYVLVDPEELEKTYLQYLSVVIDEPWLPESARSQRIRRLDIKEPYPEMSTTRNRRIREGWQAHGGVEVDTPGGKMWIHEADYELSQRAHALADGAYESEERVSVQPQVSGEEPTQSVPGFWTQWGLHLMIIGGAATLTALVVWSTLLRGRWSALRP